MRSADEFIGNFTTWSQVQSQAIKSDFVQKTGALTTPIHGPPAPAGIKRCISGHRSKSVDEFSGQEFDYVITMSDNARESCPVFPGRTRRIHLSFEDPAGMEGDEAMRIAVFRRVRNEIREKLAGFIGSELSLIPQEPRVSG